MAEQKKQLQTTQNDALLKEIKAPPIEKQTLPYISMGNRGQWKHRWGYDDTQFAVDDNGVVEVTGDRYVICGHKMPYFLPFIEEITQIPLDVHDVRKEVEHKKIASPILNAPFVMAVQKKYGDYFTMDDEERLLHSHGQTTSDEILRVLYGSLKRNVDAVFYAVEEKHIAFLIEQAQRHNVCLVPFGGGTSVSAALELPKQEKRMIVSVDVSNLSKILCIDKENMTVTVEAGIMGLKLEQSLNKMGLTLGHEPDSIEFSTVGGWIATNASGMKKNRYGNIEDIVLNFRMLTANGVVEYNQTQARTSVGVHMPHMLIGSEGNFGIVTLAVLQVHKMPEVKQYESLIFHDFEKGVAFLRDLRDVNILPASVRLVDNLQLRFGLALRSQLVFPHTIKAFIERSLLRMKGFDKYKMVMATIVFEGSKKEIAFQRKMVTKIAKKQSALLGGSTNGQRGYNLTYAIAYIRDFVSNYYILGETYETTVPWSKIFHVCDAVSKKANELHHQYNFPGRPYVSPRITQIYASGVCIYFTHGLSLKGVKNAEDVFAKMEKEIRAEILKAGGSISHHHGVGKIRQQFMKHIYAKPTRDAVCALKKHLDPLNVFGIRNNLFS